MYNNNRSNSSSSRGGDRSFGPRRDFGGFRGGDNREQREMFEATCDQCGKPCQLPFRPNGTKPVYCSNCFEKNGDAAGNSRPRFERSSPSRSFSKPAVETRSYDLEKIEAKLDKILSILEDLTTEEVEEEPEIMVPKEKKAKKEEKVEQV